MASKHSDEIKSSVWKRKDNRYGYYVRVDGKDLKKSVANTEKEANRIIGETISAYKRGEFVHSSKETLASWLEVWLKEYAANAVKRQTLQAYSRDVRNHIVPALGTIKLQALQTHDIQTFINNKTAKFAPATVKHMSTVLSSALKQALENRLIAFDPSAHIKLPKMKQKKIEALTTKEYQALLSALPDNTDGRAIRFILNTGLRVSELCGLRWCDVDIAHSQFTVNQTLYYYDGELLSEDEARLRTSTPKTEAGRRVIPLSNKVCNILKEQFKAQEKERAHAAECWHDEGYVFATCVGSPKDMKNLGRSLRRYCDTAGIKRIGPHMLRHTFATEWVHSEHGFAKTRELSEILGHTNVSFTIQTYVHADSESKRTGMEAMAAIF